jgi:methyl-accepting chemotaxis protein
MIKMFNNLSIALKVGFLSGVLLALAFGIGGVSIYMTGKIGTEIENIAEGNIPMTDILTKIEAHQLGQAVVFERALRQAVQAISGRNTGAHDSVAEFEKSTAEFVRLGALIVDEYGEAEQIIGESIARASSSTEIAAFEGFIVELKSYEAQHVVYEKDVEAMFHLLEQGQFEAALAQIDAIEEQQTKVSHTIEELVAHVETETTASARNAEEHGKTALSTILILLGITGAFGILFAIAIGGGISGSLRKITGAMTRLAEGGEASEIDVPGLGRRDEIGAMAKALEVFRESAIDKAEMERRQAQEIAAREQARAAQAEKDAAIQAEIDSAVSGAVAGDFSGRVDTAGFDGIMLNLGSGMNALLETVDRGLSESVEIMGAMADGDLTRRMTGDYQGSFLKMKDDANRMAEQIGAIVQRITTATGSVRDASAEIESGASDLATRAESQAASLEETAAAMEQIAATVKTNAENALQANGLATTTQGQAERGREVVAETVHAMTNIRESAAEISDIVSTIEAIAFQTNLLALNAAVEAARAGDAGKGFAVVASEVRTLAQRSGEAAKTIKVLIGKSTEHVAAGDRLVGATDAALTEILEGVRNVARTIEEISDASREQTTGVEEVSITVSQMDELTQQNAAMADRSAASARSLTEQSETLVELVRFFATREASGADPAARTARDQTAWDHDARAETRPESKTAKKPATPPRPAAVANGTWNEF